MKKNIIIVGSDGLIGSAIYESLSDQYNIIGIDLLNKKKINNFYKADITKENSTKKVFKNIYKKFKKIDCIINSAYPRNNALRLSFEKLSLKNFNTNINLNLGSLFNLIKNSYKYLKTNKYSSFINISSIYGSFTPRYEIYDLGKSPPAVYQTLKAGQIMMIKHFASYSTFNNDSITFNSISPGGVSGNEDKKFKRNYKKFSRKTGMINAQNISGIVKLLLSKEGEVITGQDFIIDDGFSL